LTANDKYDFDPRKVLAAIGEDRHVLAFPARQTIVAQGDAADSVFYVVKGKVGSKRDPILLVLSQKGRSSAGVRCAPLESSEWLIIGMG